FGRVPKSGARQPGEGQNSPSAQTCPSQFPADTRRIWQRLHAGYVKSNGNSNFKNNPNVKTGVALVNWGQSFFSRSLRKLL
ncbi:hypothetical protein, partial [Collimonas humicola]|uniref:hypothetical protein n=1 Tax=Collimonas humicola TaxID=2825886 RepID=UPI001B8BA782